MAESPAEPGVEIRIVDDDRRALLVFKADAAIDELDGDRLRELARAGGVGVDDDVAARLDAALERFLAAPGPFEVEVAEAVEPTPGANGWLEWADGFDPVATPDEAAAAADRVDHYSRIRYVRVATGSHVATIHPPQPGVEGRHLDGKVVRPAPVSPCTVRTDASVRVGGDGRIVSVGDGVLRYEDGQIRVARLFEVAGWVDFAVGNIDFDGTVTVGEGVRDRFMVKTTEDLVVRGVVEAAVIRCGGDFVCNCGMAGRGHGLLQVDGSAELAYLNAVYLDVRGDVAITREMIGCHGTIGGDLHAEHAGLIGGDVAVVGSAHLGQIGADSARATMLVMGSDATQERLDRSQARLVKQIAERQDELDRLGRGARDQARCRGLREEVVELESRLAAREAASARLAAAVRGAEGAPEPGIHVAGTIHPRVRLVMGDFDFSVHKPLVGPLTIRWVRLDEPVIDVAGAAPQMLAERLAA